MKRQFLFATGLLMAGSIILVSSCSKDDDGDTTPPVITLVGNSSEEVILNSSYADAGATANDEEDGAILVTTDNPVDYNAAATYTVTYTATDNSGNTATATRTVRVYNQSEGMAGNYTVVENNIHTYTQQITASTTVNKRLHFDRFGDYDNNPNIYVDVTGSTIDLDSQTAVGIGTSGCTHLFSQNGTGNSITQVQEKYTFSIKFWDDQQDDNGCEDTDPVDYEDVFVQN